MTENNSQTSSIDQEGFRNSNPQAGCYTLSTSAEAGTAEQFEKRSKVIALILINKALTAKTAFCQRN
jgi:hypothetical protein